MVKQLLPLWLLLLLVACTSQSAPPRNAEVTPAAAAPVGGPVTVEVAYLNHPPIRPLVDEVRTTLEGYRTDISVTWYDLDTDEGQAFATQQGLTGHTPLAIYIDGTMDYQLGERTVTFFGFPQGEGMPMMPEGAWTLGDLKQVLAQLLGQSP